MSLICYNYDMYQIRAKRKYANILIAPFGRRIKAALVDFLLVLVLGFFSFMAVDAIYTNSRAGTLANITFYNIKKNSMLYHAYDETRTTAFLNLDINDRDNYVRYLSGLELFYTTPNTGFIYEKSVYYVEDVAFNYRTMVLKEGQDDSFFDFETPTKTVPYSFKANLSPGDRNEVWKNLYANALTDLYNNPAYQKAEKVLKQFIIFNLSFSAFAGTLLPMLATPFFFGHGRTLGKYLTGLAVVDKDGYKVSWWRVLIRFLVYGVVEIGLNFYGFFMPLLLTSGAVALTRKHQALHDLFSGTYVVDARTSKIFNSVSDEEEYFSLSSEEQELYKNYYQEKAYVPLKKI